MAKLRYQNPTPGDEVKLQIVSFNSNNLADVVAVNEVKIYNVNDCDPNCPEKGSLITTVPGSDVIHEELGKYYINLQTSSPSYVVGKYSDVWNFELPNGLSGTTTKSFALYDNLWAFSTLPPVYSFDFQFQPNQIRKGSKKYIIIKIIPNIPRASALEEFYYNLAVVADLYVNIDNACSDCAPQDCSDDLVVDSELIEEREKCFGYYYIDTTDFECGTYNIWFKLVFGNTEEVSRKYQFQII
jgi:hypothetical protein